MSGDDVKRTADPHPLGEGERGAGHLGDEVLRALRGLAAAKSEPALRFLPKFC